MFLYWGLMPEISGCWLGFWSSVNIAVFRHDLQVKSGELSMELTQTLPFTHAQHSRRFSAQTNSQLRWNSRMQQTETGSEVLTLLCRSRDHVYNTPTPLSALTTTNYLEIFVSVSTCVTAFYPGAFLFSFCFLSLCLTHVPPPENFGGSAESPSCLKASYAGLCNPLVFLHTASSHAHPPSPVPDSTPPLPHFHLDAVALGPQEALLAGSWGRWT